MNAVTEFISLSQLSESDETALETVNARQDFMLERVTSWSEVNTGSLNAEGLNTLYPMIVNALREDLEAKVEALPTEPIEEINNKGTKDSFQSGPVIRAQARLDAPIRVVMTGHGPLKDKIGYEIILTPDEETGNFASAPFLHAAAKEAHIGLTFEPAMDCDSLAGARKGSGIWDIVLRGKASHAGRAPEAGRSAISAAADLALRVEALNSQREGVTFNVGKIDGGNAVNIVPDLAIVRMGSRAPTAHMHGGFYRPPKPRNAAQDELISNVKETGKAIGLELNFKDTGGVCEGNNVFAAGTPSIADGRIDAPAIKKLMKQ